MTRVWKDIPGTRGRYEVSNDGLVRTKPRVLKPYPLPRTGHLYVTVAGRRVYVHRLVAEAFIENPGGKPTVNHKNSDPSDNRAVNLEWATYSENVQHGWTNNRDKHRIARPVMAHGAGPGVSMYPDAPTAARQHGVTKTAIYTAIRTKSRCCGLWWGWA